jgi:hypothetical protein
VQSLRQALLNVGAGLANDGDGVATAVGVTGDRDIALRLDWASGGCEGS